MTTRLQAQGPGLVRQAIQTIQICACTLNPQQRMQLDLAVVNLQLIGKFIEEEKVKPSK